SRPAGDLNLDRFQAAILHSQAQLFVNFPDSVLLEAVTHARSSVGAGNKATFKPERFVNTSKQREWSFIALPVFAAHPTALLLRHFPVPIETLPASERSLRSVVRCVRARGPNSDARRRSPVATARRLHTQPPL